VEQIWILLFLDLQFALSMLFKCLLGLILLLDIMTGVSLYRARHLLQNTSSNPPLPDIGFDLLPTSDALCSHSEIESYFLISVMCTIPAYCSPCVCLIASCLRFSVHFVPENDLLPQWLGRILPFRCV
jgi:hypothetical protein